MRERTRQCILSLYPSHKKLFEGVLFFSIQPTRIYFCALLFAKSVSISAMILAFLLRA